MIAIKKMKKLIVTAVLVAADVTAGLAQEHLPSLKYSKEPAVLQGCVVTDGSQKAEYFKVVYKKKYNSGTEDARIVEKAELDENGCFTLSLPTGTTVECRVMVSRDHDFNCYVVPGDVTSFTLDFDKLKTGDMAEAVVFDGPLADFNHDLVYAREKGFDPSGIYVDINMKANAGELVAELPEASENGYYQYLDSTYRRVNAMIDADTVIGNAYREFAKAVNHYEYVSAIPYCAYSIRYAGLSSEGEYEAFAERQRRHIESGLKEENWDSPELSYVMWNLPDLFLPSDIEPPVRLPEEYRQCYLASKFMVQIGKDSQLLSEAQIDSVRTFLPELGQDVLDYNNQLEQKLAFINEEGMSRICTLSDDKIHSGDILSAILEPYRGRPVLIDLWETTCGPCRMAFKEMHEKKKELSDRMYFVNIASERSDLSTWQRLVPSFIGDHYRLTEDQLLSLHSQLPCDTNGVPVWVLINPDGSIHHAFVGWGGVDYTMEHLEQVLTER